ncbi:hypothetical protein [Zooshikella sp. RANM57]|uniref:hypothetical protein n=1 Tax=Zooshikella sp. RANM57 TaxID=3425863 RepID=UPI003D6E03BC
MGKGIRMLFARKKDDPNDKVYKIYELSTKDRGNLRCEHCVANITYVPEYPKKNGSVISAYLRLLPKISHSHDCPNDVDNAVRRIVAKSEAVEDIEPIFDRLSKHEHIFRMNILVKAHQNMLDLSQAKIKNNQGNQHRTEYIQSEHKIAPYFRSATGIARIRSILDNEEDNRKYLEKIIKIEHDSKIMKWNEFYYDDSRYNELYQLLINKKIKHPIALEVTPKGQFKESPNASLYKWNFQCYKQPDTENKAYIPRIYISNKDTLKKITPEKSHIVVGIPWLPKNTDNPIFKNINISVHSTSQVEMVFDIHND